MIKQCKSWQIIYFLFVHLVKYLVMLSSLAITSWSLTGPTWDWLPGGDQQGGILPGKGQNPPQGRLWHLELLPDCTQRDPSPPELHCCPFGVLSKVFSGLSLLSLHDTTGQENGGGAKFIQGALRQKVFVRIRWNFVWIITRACTVSTQILKGVS